MTQPSRRWRLDPNVGPTPLHPSTQEIGEALDALWIVSDAGEPLSVLKTGQLADQMLESPLAGVLVALVKHLGRSGMYVTVEVDQDLREPD